MTDTEAVLNGCVTSLRQQPVTAPAFLRDNERTDHGQATHPHRNRTSARYQEDGE